MADFVGRISYQTPADSSQPTATTSAARPHDEAVLLPQEPEG